MGTDVSDFSKKYSRKTGSPASPIVMPETVTVTLGGIKLDGEQPSSVHVEFVKAPFETRYGTNPHQQFGFYTPKGKQSAIGNMTVHQIGKGGFSLTNLQDMSQAVNTLKYFDGSACFILKHIVPCGGAAVTADDLLINVCGRFQDAFAGDPRAAFGGTIAFNRTVDAETATQIMGTFFENVLAPDYTADALKIFGKNAGTKELNNALRVVQVSGVEHLPKFWDDDVKDYLSLRSLPTGELSLEVPYLTGVRSVDDLIVDPQIKDVEAQRKPSARELRDGLHAWYTVMNVRSNGIVIWKNGRALGIGTGQQDRVGAVENAIEKAKKYAGNLEGAVLASDAFFPKPDSIETAAKAGVSAIVWPAGSIGDKAIIAEANKYGMAMMVPKTGERCFLHI